MREEIRFIADVMVGKLARWLRVLGCDVLYSNRFEDDEIIRIAAREDRIILTRDTGLIRRHPPPRSLLIDSGSYQEQIRQVIHTFGLKDFNVFSRCLQCNSVLRVADKEEVFERVPPYIYLTQDRFAICPDCSRIYWHGTHADEMRQRAAEWLQSDA